MNNWSVWYSEKVDRVQPSVISEMMYLVKERKALSFTAGEPSVDLFPLDGLKEAFARAFEDPSTLSYHPDNAGLKALREWIVQWMVEDKLLPPWVSAGNIILTNGSQEGVNLIAEALVNPGDTVMVESPSYPEAMGTFRKEGARFVSVPVDKDGPDLNAMEELLQRERVKCFYTIVNFQNPTGCTTSDDRKARVLELARSHGFFVIEDDPYRNLRLEGEPTDSYIRMAGSYDRVIYLGSFSKILAPGLRCGWVVAPSGLASKLVELRVSIEISLSALVQKAVYEFLSRTDMKSHLGSLRSVYKKRRDALVSALREHAVPLGVRFDVPKGGFFLWGEIADVKDIYELAKFAILEEGVGFIPGKPFFPDGAGPEGCVRLSYAKVSPEEAKEGAIRLSRAIQKFREIETALSQSGLAQFRK
jgi:2-aminoadipate transaminase